MSPLTGSAVGWAGLDAMGWAGMDGVGTSQHQDNASRILTWVSEVEIILYVAGQVHLSLLFLPVRISFGAEAHEDPEEDDHGHLPEEAYEWEPPAHVRVLRHPLVPRTLHPQGSPGAQQTV